MLPALVSWVAMYCCLPCLCPTKADTMWKGSVFNHGCVWRKSCFPSTHKIPLSDYVHVKASPNSFSTNHPFSRNISPFVTDNHNLSLLKYDVNSWYLLCPWYIELSVKFFAVSCFNRMLHRNCTCQDFKQICTPNHDLSTIHPPPQRQNAWRSLKGSSEYKIVHFSTHKQKEYGKRNITVFIWSKLVQAIKS